MKKVAASSTAVTIKKRLRYIWSMLKANISTLTKSQNFSRLRADFCEYEHLCREHVGKELDQCRVLEIGFGQRPYRFYLMQTLGADVTAVDLEAPTLGLMDVAAVYQRNGLLRMLKGAVRAACFDSKVYRDFGEFVKREFQKNVNYASDGLVIADSSSEAFWAANPGPYDLVYSEDVFEHIPKDAVEAVTKKIAEHLSPGGIVLIRPMVFTGICGGHHYDWYPGSFESDKDRVTPPWDHLLDNQYEADTFLNRMTRRNYRDLFAAHFEVLAEDVANPDLGRAFLTSELRTQLHQYDDYELFSNNVLFVLRKSIDR